MKTIHSKHKLPSSFSGHPANQGRIVAEFDIKVGSRDKVKLKVLIFKSNRALCQFWCKAIADNGLGKKTGGIVQPLSCDRFDVDSQGGLSNHRHEVDPVYFSVMGLLLNYLSTEVIVHESVHAAINYSKRVKKKWPGARDCPEENICYPAGIIASKINKFLHKYKLYDL